MLTLVAFLICFMVDLTFSSAIGRESQSTNELKDTEKITISLVSIFIGPCILYTIIGLFRGKNMCYSRTICDKICSQNITSYIDGCDDICDEDCTDSYSSTSITEVLCTSCCKCICYGCEICSCPYEEVMIINSKSPEETELEKMSKTINEYSDKKKIKTIQPQMQSAVVAPQPQPQNIIISDEAE